MSTSYPSKSAIVIPIKNSTEDEIIEIDFNHLPSDGEDLLQILKDEQASLHYWLDLALEFYRRGCTDDFVKILTRCGGESGGDYAEYERDQVRALDMLAAYYVSQGNKERNETKRKEWFTKATLLYTTADKMIMHDQNHLLGRATFCLVEGSKLDPGTSANPNQTRKAKMEQAKAQFDFVINQGKACIAFDESRYKDALSYFKRCLRINPNCPADIRVGMGYCLARLGKMEKSRLAFERALELDPSNISAIVALAVLDINTLTLDGIKSGIQSLSTAYQIEPENPMVLNHLANHFFCRNDLEKTEQLAYYAITIAENDAMKAESCYHLARCYHKKGNYADASRFYYQSTTLAHPKFVLPHFGLGQNYICQEDYEKAIASFEKVLKICPNNYETLCALGSLYANVKTSDPKIALEMREKARALLKKCIDVCPDDVEVLIELAQLQEKNDPQASLKLYLKVIEILQSEGMEVPPEIYNNAACLYFSLNQLAEAKKYFQEARNSVLFGGTENLSDEYTALLITITYNLGRINEQLCLFDDAEKLYRQIIRQRPSYVDCILRLGCLYRDKGDTHSADLLFKESVGCNPTNADPWTLIGNMHMSKYEWIPAQKKFEQILKMPNGQNDTYSLIALGNIWLEILFSARTKEKDDQNRSRALNFYSKALKLRPQNIWAANGIGCILAHKGAFLDARDIFSQVREATADFPDVWINIAHIYMEQKQFISALQMYKNCMAKFNRFNDVNLLLYVARAFWKSGKLTECRDFVERAIIESPDNLIIRFNHAVVLQKMATNILKEEKATSVEVLNAIEDLKTAEKTFSFISEQPPEEIIRFKYLSRTICRGEAGQCNDLLKQAVTYLQRAQTKDEEERRQREFHEEQRRRIVEQQQVEDRRKQEEKLKEVERLKQMRQEYVDKTKEILKFPEIKDEKKIKIPTQRKRREDAPDFINDDSDEYAGEYERDEYNTERREKTHKRIRNASGSGSEQSLDAERGIDSKLNRRKKRDLERAEDGLLPARLRNKVKSKAFVSSSSSSSDEAEKKESSSDDESDQDIEEERGHHGEPSRQIDSDPEQIDDRKSSDQNVNPGDSQ